MSIVLDPTVPADSESPRQGAARIRGLTLQILSLLSQGGGAAVSFSAAPFVVTTAGKVTILTELQVPTPTIPSDAANKGYVDSIQIGTILPHGVASGTNSYAVTLSPAITSQGQINGVPISVKFPNTNTGVSTLNANGLGAKNIYFLGSALSAGAIPANDYVTLIWDGSLNYYNLQLSPINVASTPAPSLSNAIVNGTVNPGPVILMSVSSTPPSSPSSTQLYRALVSYSVYFQSHASNNANLATWISDSATLFTTLVGMEARSGGSGDVNSCSASFLSNATRTNAQGVVTFRVSGSVSNNRADILTDSDSGAIPSTISVAWIPAQ